MDGTNYERICATLRALIRRPIAEQPAWFREAQIQAVGAACRYSANSPTGDLALKVYVERKRPRRTLRSPIPPRVDLGYGPMDIDVHAIGKLQRASGPQAGSAVYNGINPGNSGTTSCILQSRTAGGNPKYLLSCAHVLAPNGAKVGDPVHIKDQGNSHHVGTLRAWSTMQIAAGGTISVDAAIAELNVPGSPPVDPAVSQIGMLALLAPTEN